MLPPVVGWPDAERALHVELLDEAKPPSQGRGLLLLACLLLRRSRLAWLLAVFTRLLSTGGPGGTVPLPLELIGRALTAAGWLPRLAPQSWRWFWRRTGFSDTASHSGTPDLNGRTEACTTDAAVLPRTADPTGGLTAASRTLLLRHRAAVGLHLMETWAARRRRAVDRRCLAGPVTVLGVVGARPLRPPSWCWLRGTSRAERGPLTSSCLRGEGPAGLGAGCPWTRAATSASAAGLREPPR